MGGEVVLMGVCRTTSERIFTCNHQRTTGLSKSRSLFVERLGITKKRRRMTVLANVA